MSDKIRFKDLSWPLKIIICLTIIRYSFLLFALVFGVIGFFFFPTYFGL